MKVLFVLALSFSLLACAQIGEKRKGRTFPYGQYEQEVELNIKAKAMRFKAVLSLGPDRLLMVGLSPFQSTLFRYTRLGDQEGELQVFEPKIKAGALGRLLNRLDDYWSSPQGKVSPGFKVTQTSDQGVPLVIELNTPYFTGKVRTLRYEVAKSP